MKNHGFCLIFLCRAISGHMVGHIVKNQKYVKIAKITILVRNSIFDISADMMIYGRKWVPEVL